MNYLVWFYVFCVGAYVFFESAVALAQMPKVALKDFYKPYLELETLKFTLLGFYGLLVIYHAEYIVGWYSLLIAPAVLCVVGRTAFRVRRYMSVRKLRIINNSTGHPAHANQ